MKLGFLHRPNHMFMRWFIWVYRRTLDSPEKEIPLPVCLHEAEPQMHHTLPALFISKDNKSNHDHNIKMKYSRNQSFLVILVNRDYKYWFYVVTLEAQLALQKAFSTDNSRISFQMGIIKSERKIEHIFVIKGHTTIARTTEIAKEDVVVPSWRPIAVASAVTVAEWDDGIPPDAINLLESHLFSLYLHI